MRLGVDFGTTRTTIAEVDRGNYPLATFADGEGDGHEYIPSVAALGPEGLVYGFQAAQLALGGAPHARSFKRLLASPDVTANTAVHIGQQEFPLLELVTGFLTHVAEAVRATASAGDRDLEAVVGIPAHAHSAQRFLTLEAFKAAGFNVITMLNEPSAAGFEYTHRHAGTVNSRRTKILVYDLGGGTFDASLVSVEGKDHEVLGSHGNNLLGGDDFDVVLAECAARAAGSSKEELDESAWHSLVEASRLAKETLVPQSRFVTIDVDGSPVTLPVSDFYEAASPLVESTFSTMEPLMDVSGDQAAIAGDVAGLYVVGGGSELPVVSRMLRKRYGRRVHRSPYTAGSTAIGLAIAADPEAGYSLSDRLSRGVGVFREGESGAVVTFDALLSPQLRVSPGEPVSVTRRYNAAHDVGRYRFVEYADLRDGEPAGAVIPCGQISFPFEASLRDKDVDLDEIEVHRSGHGPLVEENYTVDENGIVEVSIREVDSGFEIRRSLASRHG
ncbi:MAG: Hsp70 family protein [Actinomycetaceae bacterium]|nr:Hsp70 family protein [Actinomycetaceae bacterium]